MHGSESLNYPDGVTCSRFNIQHVAGSGRLPFSDQSFDIVISGNVLEHAPVQSYVSEAYRVLKWGGIVVIFWEASWSSDRGYHVHKDMFWGRFKADTLHPGKAISYENNNKFIPSWGHLLYNKQEMREILLDKNAAPADVLELVLDFMYDSGELNRYHLADVSMGKNQAVMRNSGSARS